MAVCKPLRRINMGAAASPAAKQNSADTAADNFIQQHIRYPLILDSLRCGTRVPELARWFAMEQWINVSEQTFAQYLYSFRRRHPQLLDGADPIARENGKRFSFNQLAPGQTAAIDPRQEAVRLLKLQQDRIAIDVSTEHHLGKLFQNTAKEFEIAGKLVEVIAKIDGKIGRGGDGNSDGTAVNGDVRDTLRGVKTDELQRGKLHNLTNQLSEALNETNNARKNSLQT